MLERLKTHLARKWIVKTAVISNIVVLIVDVAIWASYRAMTSSDHVLLFILVNAVVSMMVNARNCAFDLINFKALFSALLSSMASVAGILSGMLSSTGGVLTARNDYFDYNNTYRREDIPLGPISAAAPFEQMSSNTVTVVVLEKTRGSSVWETVKVAVVDREYNV